ncbi:hypothetical protein LXL04_018180 [Taraxacum kok-saghyz]
MNTIDPGPDSMQQSENAYLTTSKFDSYDELVKSVREFYYTKGYGISIRGSNPDKYVILQCDRGGSYRDIRGISGKRKKSTITRLINCPFQIVGKKQGHDGAWMIKIKDLSHNHEPSEDIFGHPSFRQLPSESTDRFDDLLNELRLKYQMWPLNKKEDALSLITKLVNQYDTVFEPVIQRPKGRPPKSKKKRGVTSTTRFPSRFELIESSQRRTFIDLNAYPFDTCDLDGLF